MKIIDISPENERLFYCCLEDWSEEIKEVGNHKQNWYRQMKTKGVRVKFAMDEENIIGGMVQYMPIEDSIFEGENLYVVLCIWIHGHKEGRGNFQRRGMGKSLLKAAEEDCRSLGANGLVTWGLIIPAFMRASWYKRQGYKVIDKKGIMRLLWKPFNEKAVPPKFIKPKRQPEKGKGKVNISVFRNGWCPVMNLVYERALRASKEFKDKVDIREYETTDREIVREWGITDGLYIDGKEVRTGPPPSYDKIKEKILRRVKKLKYNSHRTVE
jgi:hypothetical protein